MSSFEPKYSGMTVNERLVAAGILGEWDAAINAGDREKAIQVLGRIELPDLAAWIADTTLASPARYGFSRPPSSP